jgi:hypothetical protein
VLTGGTQEGAQLGGLWATFQQYLAAYARLRLHKQYVESLLCVKSRDLTGPRYRNEAQIQMPVPYIQEHIQIVVEQH